MTDRPGGSGRIRLLPGDARLQRKHQPAAFYTAYYQPEQHVHQVKEIAFQFGADDRDISDAPHSPYALVAFEFDTAPGVGQADGGDHAGQYLELGIAPGYTASRASLTVPVKVGMSLGDYYELNVRRQRHPYSRTTPSATPAWRRL